MRLFLVIDETHFYHPNFVAELIKKTEHEVVGAALVTKVLPKSNIERYIIRNFYYLTISELYKLVVKKLILLFKSKLYKFNIYKDFYSVKDVYDHYGIEYFEVEYDINKKEYINQIKNKNPDVIISSNSLICSNKILKIPKYCINRHSSLLPSYGGLWPVFHAIRKEENKVGVSVHIMGKRIDRGILLAQTVIPIHEKDSLDILYKKCFARSAEIVLRAIKRIEEDDLETLCNDYKSSYYSFPKKEHWREFRKMKIRFI